MDLNDFDLNLLLVFDQLLKERKVSSVADSLGVTQPAVSRSLKRLRQLLGDELFCRTASGMEPTAYARHLAEPIGYALDSLRQAIGQEFSFDPASSRRTFTLRITDIGEIYILPRLLPLLDAMAPGVSTSVTIGALKRPARSIRRTASAWLMSSPSASLKAWPMATSREAEEERPVPCGTLPETTRLRPRRAWPRACTWCTRSPGRRCRCGWAITCSCPMAMAR